MEMVRELLDIVTIIIALAPIGIKIFQLIAQKTHNQRLINLSQRAQIIVEGLEQSNLTNEEKKTKAYKKLSAYANEVGIPVTVDQLDDYIESAVRLVKVLTTP
mgnify:FL=1